jgi:capsular polysaccharide biosynthesis protein
MQNDRNSKSNNKIKWNEKFTEKFVDDIRTDDVEQMIRDLNNIETFQQVNADDIANNLAGVFSKVQKKVLKTKIKQEVQI